MEWYKDFTANLSWLGIVAGTIAVVALGWGVWWWRASRKRVEALEKVLAGANATAEQQQAQIASLHEAVAAQQQAQNRENIALALLRTYQDSLLQAAQDLQSKLFNILRLHLLRNFYFDGSFSEKEYSVENTLYVVSGYLCWVEVIRREVQFLSAAQEQQSQRMMQSLGNVAEVFLTSSLPATFRIFRGEQRAIGEIMMTSTDHNSNRREPIGYASFLKMRKDEEFSRWFRKLRMDIDDLANGGGNADRLVRLQNALVDLIDILDPDYARVPQNIRGKVQMSEVSLP
jgi:hypothetical protein